MTRAFIALFIAAMPAVGVMTWYSLPGGVMRNGQPFDDHALQCAVDASWWNTDKDAPYYDLLTICVDSVDRSVNSVDRSATNPRHNVTSTVVQEHYEQCIDVAVTDTGYLAPYGVLVDCSPRVWTEMGIPLSVGRQDVIVWSRNVSATAYTPCSK